MPDTFMLSTQNSMGLGVSQHTIPEVQPSQTRRLPKKYLMRIQQSGWSLRPTASTFFAERLNDLPEESRIEFVDLVLEKLGTSNILKHDSRLGKAKVLDWKAVKQAMEEVVDDREATMKVIDADTADISAFTRQEKVKTFRLVDTFALKRMVFNKDRRTFVPAQPLKSGSSLLLGDAADRPRTFRDRFDLLLSKVFRLPQFRKEGLPYSTNSSSEDTDKGTVVGNDGGVDRKFTLTPLEAVAGTEAGKLIYVFGMLARNMETGSGLCLESPLARVPIVLAEDMVMSQNLFYHGCFVLCSGIVRGGQLIVGDMTMPGAESRDESIRYYRTVDFTGGERTFQGGRYEELLGQEQRLDVEVTVFSDFTLDDPQVLERFEGLLHRWEEMDLPGPDVYIFCGPFLSTNSGMSVGNISARHDRHHAMHRLQKALAHFGRLLDRHKSLIQDVKMYYVPAMSDPGMGSVMPRPPIPAFVTEQFRKKFPTAEFTTNPCRIRWMTQEIVVVRHDTFNRLRRNVKIKTTADDSMTEADDGEQLWGDQDSRWFAKTVLDQADCVPLPSALRPTYWNLDHTLWLYPLPDVVITADNTESFHFKYYDTSVVNPGPFNRGDHDFVNYLAAARTMQQMTASVDAQLQTDNGMDTQQREQQQSAAVTVVANKENIEPTYSAAATIAIDDDGHRGLNDAMDVEEEEIQPQKTSLSSQNQRPSERGSAVDAGNDDGFSSMQNQEHLVIPETQRLDTESMETQQEEGEVNSITHAEVNRSANSIQSFTQEFGDGTAPQAPPAVSTPNETCVDNAESLHQLPKGPSLDDIIDDDDDEDE
eukprot:Clim_evm14s198 gene=Clim_evmTU14s198